MRLPIIPLVVAATILGLAFYLFNSTGARRTMDAPRLARLGDIAGLETQVAISPDGSRYAVISDGDLWLLDSDGSQTRLTESAEAESSPSWSPDGSRIAFTRGRDTFAISSKGPAGLGDLLKADATDVSWAASGRLAFVRDRALWIADISGRNDKILVPADPSVNIRVRSPKFSPDSLQIAFIQTLLDITGQVHLVDASSGTARMLVGDRLAENPLDVGWLMDGRQLVYLTNRAGAYSLWYIDFAANTLMPLTQPLMGIPLANVGIGTWKERVVLPRHLFDANIALSDGTAVVKSDEIEFEPAVSRDGKRVVYTVIKDNNFNIWTANLDGSNATFRSTGREPRFTPDGFHIVYTHTDLNGNPDVWRLDTRDGASEPVTDADEMDLTPDPSPDGAWIVFSSTRGVAPSIWLIPASGGKRLRIHDGGFAPRFSADSRTILFRQDQRLWSMNADGTNAHPTSDGSTSWPRPDVLPDGRQVIAPITIRDAALWTVDLVFRTQ